MSGENGKAKIPERRDDETPKPECHEDGMVRVRRVRGPVRGFHREMDREVVIGGEYEVSSEMAERMCAEGGEFERVKVETSKVETSK